MPRAAVVVRTPAHGPRPVGWRVVRSLRFLACCGLAAAWGCGAKPSAPADPAQARDALEAALEAWQSGEQPAALRERRPPVHVADEDWLAGLELTAFELGPEGRVVGTTLRQQAVLSLKDAAGRPVRKSVRYAVGTDPVVSIVRED